MITLLLVLLAGARHAGGTELLIEEEFNDLSAWKDLSTAITWAGQPPDGSAWSTTGGVLSFNAAGISSVGLTPWDSVLKSRSFTAIDYQFPTPLSHRKGTLVIEFRVQWDSLIDELRGEWNRINIMLIHDYPLNGLDLTRDLRVYDFSKAWWGRPSYQLRIRGSDTAEATALLMTGGGYEPEGEFEIYYDSTGTLPLWWLPSFSTTAGGALSDGGPSPGVGRPWPYNGWSRSSTGLASLQWQRFRYVISPYGQSLYIDPDDDGLNWILDGYLPLPEEVDAPATAPLYHYFDQHEGLRVYFRGYENARMDYLKLWYTPESELDRMEIVRVEDQFAVSFQTEVGKSYQLEHSTDLDEWSAVFPPQEGDGLKKVIVVSTLIPGHSGFFRVASTNL